MVVTAKKLKKPKKPKPEPTWAPIQSRFLLSIDASSSAVGYAICVDGKPTDFGVIRSPKSWDAKRRINANTDKLRAFVWEQFGDTISVHVVKEWQSHMNSGFRVQGLAQLGQAQGAIREMLRYLPCVVAVDCVSEREWTRIGGKNRKKEDRVPYVREWCPAYFEREVEEPGFDSPGLDAADALGLAKWRLAIQ
jgi:hypothetical protein